jgi:hypothetical protein
MPTTRYYNKSGKRLASVTTILKSWGSSEGIFRWANNLALCGIDAVSERGRMATVGSLAHDVAAQMLLGVDASEAVDSLPLEDLDQDSVEELSHCVEAWKRFYEQFSPFINVHMIEEHMVSEKYQYGGTPDAILDIGGDLVVMDIKTGKLRPEMAIQLAAYRELYRGDAGTSEQMGGVVLRLSREGEGFAMHSITSHALDLAWEMFLQIKDLRDKEQVLKRMVK